LTGGVIDDGDALDGHGKGGFAVIGRATGPLDRAGREGWVAAGPDAETDAHGCLGEAGAARGVVEVQSAHGGAVDGPDNGTGCPVDLVGVERGLGGGDAVVGCSVEG